MLGHHRSRPRGADRRGAVARRRPGIARAEVQELDRDAPDYDRALVELAALLQRIAIAQIVPEAAAAGGGIRRADPDPLGAGDVGRGCAALLPDRTRGPPRSAMAPEPRLGFEMTLLRMLAFRPRPQRLRCGGALPRAPSAAGARSGSSALRAGTPIAARVAPVAARSAAPRRSPSRRGSAARDQRTFVAGRRRGRKVERHGAPVRIELRARLVRQWMCSRCGSIRSAAERRTRAIEEKLVQGLTKYLGRDIRVIFEVADAVARHAGAAARPGGAGSMRSAPRRHSRRIRRSRACASVSAPRWMPPR